MQVVNNPFLSYFAQTMIKYMRHFAAQGYTLEEAYEAAGKYAVPECAAMTTAIQLEERLGVPKNYTLNELPKLMTEVIK